MAGRPLTVDDAATDNKGEGHVEAWYSRMPGKAHTWIVSPAYAPIEGLEFSGLIARDTTNQVNAQALQFKWIVTPPQDSGCTAGVVGGIGRARPGLQIDGTIGRGESTTVYSVGLKQSF